MDETTGASPWGLGAGGVHSLVFTLGITQLGTIWVPNCVIPNQPNFFAHNLAVNLPVGRRIRRTRH